MCIYLYILHMLDKIIIQVSRNVQILIRETNIYMKIDAAHNEANPRSNFISFMKILTYT